MREIKTIEVDKWVPGEKKGMVKHAGMISPQEAFEALKKHLESVGLMPDEYFNSNDWQWMGAKELPDYIRASCDVNWGGSEGIYLDISLLYKENNEFKRFNFATGKTLGRSGDDFLRMSRIAAECSMMLNGRGAIVKFFEEDRYITCVQEEALESDRKDSDKLDSGFSVASSKECTNILKNKAEDEEKIDEPTTEECLVENSVEGLEKILGFGETEFKSFPYQIEDLVTTYEELYNVPDSNRVMKYFGEYGMHVFKDRHDGVSLEQLSLAVHKALQAVDMTLQEFMNQKDKFLSRNQIVALMKSKMQSPSVDEQIAVAKTCRGVASPEQKNERDCFEPGR